jgi:hypothetical protein
MYLRISWMLFEGLKHYNFNDGVVGTRIASRHLLSLNHGIWFPLDSSSIGSPKLLIFITQGSLLGLGNVKWVWDGTETYVWCFRYLRTILYITKSPKHIKLQQCQVFGQAVCQLGYGMEEFLKTNYMLKRITELRTIFLDACKMFQIVKGSFDQLLPSYI